MPFSKKYHVIDTLKCLPIVPLLPSTTATSEVDLRHRNGILKFYCVCVYAPKQYLLLFSYLPKCYSSLHIFK